MTRCRCCTTGALDPHTRSRRVRGPSPARPAPVLSSLCPASPSSRAAEAVYGAGGDGGEGGDDGDAGGGAPPAATVTRRACSASIWSFNARTVTLWFCCCCCSCLAASVAAALAAADSACACVHKVKYKQPQANKKKQTTANNKEARQSKSHANTQPPATTTTKEKQKKRSGQARHKHQPTKHTKAGTHLCQAGAFSHERCHQFIRCGFHAHANLPSRLHRPFRPCTSTTTTGFWPCYAMAVSRGRTRVCVRIRVRPTGAVHAQPVQCGHQPLFTAEGGYLRALRGLFQRLQAVTKQLSSLPVVRTAAPQAGKHPAHASHTHTHTQCQEPKIEEAHIRPKQVCGTAEGTNIRNPRPSTTQQPQTNEKTAPCCRPAVAAKNNCTSTNSSTAAVPFGLQRSRQGLGDELFFLQLGFEAPQSTAVLRVFPLHRCQLPLELAQCRGCRGGVLTTARRESAGQGGETGSKTSGKACVHIPATRQRNSELVLQSLDLRSQ